MEFEIQILSVVIIYPPYAIVQLQLKLFVLYLLIQVCMYIELWATLLMAK